MEGVVLLTCGPTGLHPTGPWLPSSLNRWQFVVLIYEWKMSANNAT